MPSEWRALFESGDSDLLAEHPGVARLVELLRAAEDGKTTPVVTAPPAVPAEPEPAPTPVVDETLLSAVAAAMALVKAHRTHGHLAARLDPLGSEPVGDPALEPERLVPPLTPELQRQIPARLLRVYFPGRDARRRAPEAPGDLLRHHARTRSSTSPITSNASGCARRSRPGRYRTPLAADEKRRLLDASHARSRASSATCIARSSARSSSRSRASTCSSRCSTRRSSSRAEDGAHEVVIGMAHRGRLNVLAHIARPSVRDDPARVRGRADARRARRRSRQARTGDVKYHLGAEGRTQHAGAVTSRSSLAANPSHLEAVDPVVEGVTRAEQTDRSTRAGSHDARVGAPGPDPRRRSFPARASSPRR